MRLAPRARRRRAATGRAAAGAGAAAGGGEGGEDVEQRERVALRAEEGPLRLGRGLALRGGREEDGTCIYVFQTKYTW